MSSKRVVYFDLLNIVACIAVVFMHCNNMVFVYAPGKNWAFGLGIEVLFYWAVPIFIMISGANLMKYRDRYDTKTFFRKRLAKTFLPFVIWSVILYILRFGFEHPSQDFGVSEFFTLFFSNGIEGVYWFFFPLFALYLAMPALSLLANHRSILVYLAGTSFVLMSIIAPVCKMLGLPWNDSIDQPMVPYFVLYAILGYLCSTHDFTKKQRYSLYALGIIALFVRYAFLFATSRVAGTATIPMYFGYQSFAGVLPAVALFLLFKYIRWPEFLLKRSRTIAKISGCSFGVYLLHRILIQDVLFFNMMVPQTSIWLRTIGPLLIWALCVAFTLAIKKIPVLKHLVP